MATDARRKEVYWARYDDARTRVGEPAVDRPADIAEQVAGLPGGRRGRAALPRGLPGRAARPSTSSAAALAALAAERLAAGRGAACRPLPLYLRRPDAQVPKNYKVVTPK